MKIAKSKISFLLSSFPKNFNPQFYYSAAKNSSLNRRWVKITAGFLFCALPVGLEYLWYARALKKTEENLMHLETEKKKMYQYVRDENKFVPKK